MENNPVPQTLIEAIRQFSDADACLNFMIELRWPNGVICPRCQALDPHFISTRKMWRCNGCKKQFSVKVGTIFEDSPLGLDKWLAAVWLITNAKNGISSYEIHRALKITQKSAWFVLHRVRLATILPTKLQKLALSQSDYEKDGWIFCRLKEIREGKKHSRTSHNDHPDPAP